MNEPINNIVSPEWLLKGKMLNAQYLLIIYDEITGSYKPIFVMPDENLDVKRQQYRHQEIGCLPL